MSTNESSQVRIGTRASQLAVHQANKVKQLLQEKVPGLNCELVTISTLGDRDKTTSLTEIGGQGVFAKELQRALVAGEIDCGVHSLKDLPTDIPPEIVLAAVLERAEPRDVLIAPKFNSFKDLSNGARLGTSSRRRAAQVLSARPDLNVVELRGNVDTRMAKVTNGSTEKYDAVILAAAGVIRMGWSGQITEYLDVSTFTPAPGQAALGVDCRIDDTEMQKLLALINEPNVARTTAIERTFLNGFGGGCRSPVGAFATITDGGVYLYMMTANEDLTNVQRCQMKLPPDNEQETARTMAHEMLALTRG